MRIFGVDFTSAPRRAKPIVVARGAIERRGRTGGRLTIDGFDTFDGFAGFETMLVAPGPWVAAMDFPFGQSRRLIGNLGWPGTWHGYVGLCAALGRDGFAAALEDYKRDRAAGDREHRRATDDGIGAISPQKLYGVPVAKMFFEGAPRLRNAAVSIPPVRVLDDEASGGRVVVEGYPGALARELIGRDSYKNDSKKKQTAALAAARRRLVAALVAPEFARRTGLAVDLHKGIAAECVDDAAGDRLDAVMCAVQAAWAHERRDTGYGVPADADALEGWIVRVDLRGRDRPPGVTAGSAGRGPRPARP